MPMEIYKLQKIALTVKNKPAEFLNGITSNTLDQPRSAFLDFHGKIVVTFDQLKVDDDTFFVVIEDKFLDALMSHLERYIKLSKAIVQHEDYGVYFDLTGSYQKGEGEFLIPQRKGQLLLARKDLESNISDEDFMRFRLAHQIPLQGVDYTHEMLLNINENEFVSYTKGCFLGQEFISKVHSRSRPTWKLVIKAQDECTDEEKQKMTSKVLDKNTGKIIGFVFTANR